MDCKTIFCGLLFAVSLAILVSPFASPWPDGLEKVAGDQGFIHLSQVKPAIQSPIPDYLWPGLRNERISTAIAGATGTIMLFALALGLGYLLKKKDAS